MKKHFLCLLLIRVVLPIAFLISISIRPFGLSAVYLLLYLIAPLLKIPTPKTFGGVSSKFLLLTTSLSFNLLGVHAIWQIILTIFYPYGSLLKNYPLIQEIGHNLGLVSYEKMDFFLAVFFLTPELIMCFTSLVVYVVVKKLLFKKSDEDIHLKDTKYQRFPMLTSAGKYIVLLLLMCSGVMRPSATSAIYYIVFMGAATVWSIGKPLERGFAVVCRCLMAIMAVHLIVLLLYQLTWAEEFYPPDRNFARYFGLIKIANINATSLTSSFTYEVTEKHTWATFASPLIIMITYYVLAIESAELMKPKSKKKSALTGVEEGKLNGSLVRGVSFHRGSRQGTREKWKDATKKVRVSFAYINSNSLRGRPSETTPLMGKSSTNKKRSSVRSGSAPRQLRQDSTGSVVLDDESYVQDEPTLLDDILAAVVDFFQVLVRSSYIVTTIIMMAWSIMYHSWLTFVLLMWANIVWLRQDQRTFMLKTSPILVFYAIFLLIAQYVYGMDFTEEELSSDIAGMNLRQIGLGRRSGGEPCVPLLIKSLFACMFWLTLRQRMQELTQRRQSAVISDLAAPLQLTVTAAASGLETQREQLNRSRLLPIIGEWLRAACARGWIYVVVIMLFVIGVTGERMTIFRIIYMFLFLAFILMFQISWYWWRRSLYIFWIIVIIYAMINLILIYIYQFDNFSKTIEHYLLINERLQHDLGLEPYHPADLFVKLLTPTLFLIITIMQVHYFHKDFMALSDPKTRTQSEAQGQTSRRPSQGASTIKDDVPPLPLESDNIESEGSVTDHSLEMSSLNTAHKRSIQRKSPRSRSFAPSGTERTSTNTAFRSWFVRRCTSLKVHMAQWTDKLFLYLELHLIKIIFIALMLLCVCNVSAMHVPIMILIAPALLLGKNKQRFIILLISTMISIYLMAKMVYQIDYIKHSFFDVNCTKLDANNTLNVTTLNNAEWIGFYKTSPDRPLVTLVKGYIGLIAAFTFYSLVMYRQKNLRDDSNVQTVPGAREYKVMFPEIKRKDADTDMLHCIKYLFNYGFYKFGIEITLICLMGVIGSRMDLYGAMYAAWLLILVSMNREKQARVWPAFTAFITFLMPFQYMIAVGFMPYFCIQYPWDGYHQQMKHIRTWLFLPHAEEPPHAVKLIFDYFLVLFASRQLRVFNVEKTMGDSFPGGSNSEDIGKDWETLNFVNPVPDFLSYVGTWLDVVKRMVFLGMLWVSLAIMFMTGTNRVNLFSMGYLIGSFIFLWQGTDFYLRPKSAILQWWCWLIRYNVTVVVVKTLLQIPGCIFSAVMQEHACWLVQLLGIGCVDKFAGGNISKFLKMHYNKEAACTVPQEDIGLAWDGVCFAFLILQRRLFHSYYFYRVIDESKATTVLASRGAELIEELRQKQMNLQEEQEGKILEKIKVKMERIKANQKKIQGVMSKEPPHHDEGSETNPTPIRRRVYTKRHEACGSSTYKPPTSHQKAVRSGDYYMFDEFDDTDVIAKEDEDVSDDELPKQMGFGKLLSTVIKTDLKRAVSLRRASMPAVRSERHLSLGSYPLSYPRQVRRRSSHVDLVHEDDVDLVMSERARERRGPDDKNTDPDQPPDPDRMSETEENTFLAKAKTLLEAIWAFISSVIVSITRYLMRYSRDYRYISRTLSVEKKILKEKEGFGIGLREGSQMVWEPLPESLQPNRKLSEISVPEIRILAPSMERGLDASPPPSSRASTPSSDDTSEHESAFSLQTTESKDVTMLEEHDDSMLKQGKSPLLYFAYALWYSILAHTDIVCYIMVFINQIQSATILSIPLPLMVFLWGTLAIPRPTKTFWVTLIAYTEVIVIIKSMFQFEILPWNQKAIPPNMPFTAPRIIGIERKYNYALYDLLLLLIIFLHRFMLKSLGLWKESTPEIELREDMEYQLSPQDTEMVVEGRGAEVGQKYVQLHDSFGPVVTASRHRLVDRMYHVQETITTVMKELSASRSDPRVAHLVRERLAQMHQEARRRRKYTKKRSTVPQLRRRLSKRRESAPLEKSGSALEEDGRQNKSDSKPKASEDDHFKVNDEQEPIIAVTTTLEDTYKHYPTVILLSVKRYLRPAHRFFKRMLAPGARVTADIYAYMFLCDFFNFLVVIFGFAAFGTHQGDGGVQAYIEENKVPIPFLVMLILQFALIIIDRALYLRKFMLGKILFQYALIIGVHVWMFFVLPFITERTFNALVPPPLWYMVKCVYLLLSAYQIRCGYPRRIIGNFLCKSYNYINMLLFRGFMAVPFVFELRTMMDWIWTDTSMTLMDWLKMEDIFASVFLLKCSRYVEDEFPQPRGVKKSNTAKYLLGGGVLAFVIAIIWFPLVFFAFGNSVGEPNPPTDVTVKIRIGPFLPVYQMTAQSHNIHQFTEQDYIQLSNLYNRDRTAQTFLSNYMYNDIAVVTINPNSTMKWEISPPELERLEKEALSNASLVVKFTYVISHPSNTVQNPPTIEEHREVPIEAYIDGARNPERDKLLQLLSGTASPDTWLNVETLFPKFVKVFNKGSAKAAYQLMPTVSDSEEISDSSDEEENIRSLTDSADSRYYRHVQLRLERDPRFMYWRVREACDGRDTLMSIPLNNCDMLIMYTFNDKLFPETLNFISGSGIIGLYTTFVFLASRVLRGFFSGIYTKIMFDDLPNVDRILQLCLDIYLVREALELALEEDLFAKLVFLYRSPETMIKWSRPKDQLEEQRALQASR